MTASQWVFVAGLLIIVVAVAVIGTVSWSNRRNPSALLGFAFAVIAVVSTVNITLVGHRQRINTEETNARFQARLDCTQSIVAVLKARDEAAAAGKDPRAIEFPTC